MGAAPLAPELQLGMHHFKSPEYAQEVQRWLERHAGNANDQQRLQHLLSILQLDPTTSNLTFGMQEAYPELYREAVLAGRVQPSPSLTFHSLWGDSLKKGDQTFWRQNLKSMYTDFNQQVYPREFGQDSDTEFLKWAQRGQLYYGDLLVPEAAHHIDQWMEGAPAAEKRDMLALLRNLHATVKPDKFKSITKYMFGAKVPFSSLPSGTLEREFYKSQWMAPDTIARPASAPAVRPQSANAAADRAQQARRQLSEQSRQEIQYIQGAFTEGKPKKAAKLPKDTFKSNVPLKWGGGTVGAAKSTYTAMHGVDMPTLIHRVEKALVHRQSAGKPVEITSPFGTLDPRFDHSGFTVFPVPRMHFQPIITPGEPGRNNPDATHYGRSYRAAEDEEALRHNLEAAAAATAHSKAERSRVTVPLGKNGLQDLPAFMTTYMREYIPRKLDLNSRSEVADGIRKTLNAPTASVGPVMGCWA
ncbi:hypothetical protein WJX72_010646 [[Myrmecia] bisecta]|uniref:Uncharacterized protein n=1 Tax=[Myrmecia] bisecta TaxID=41462 RepID=A0AAW1QGB4_9CHLO